jgi:transposase InsO family protein
VDEVGNRNILVVVDNFTKYVELFPVKSMDAETTAQCLLSVFARYGNIKRVCSDRGSQFVFVVV